MEMQQENETGREGVIPKSEKEVALISNQETEKAAMISGGKEGSVRDSESPSETATTQNIEHTTKPLKLDGIFARPATPPNKAGLTTKSASSSRSSSLKKQRRGSRGSANLNVAGTGDGAPKRSAPGGGQLNYGTNSVGNDLMKQSQSMTSLKASNEEQQESRDVIQAKLHLERPYNSLKKNSHSNKMHRYSWGSGNSQCSSTSLHSSATLGLGSSGKDDLWAAIQTNYNYIMDTNLLDTCKEARCEIEGAATVLEKSSDCSFKMLDETQRPEGLCEDPKELRRWLREMENKLESSPTITELTLFGNAELQRHLSVHSVLYHEIASHARVVSSCIRAAEKEQQLQQQQQLSSQQPASLTSNCSSESTSESATKSSSLSSGFASDPLTTPIGTAAAAPPPSSNHPFKKGEGNLERLRDRYHLLYLKAFELQLCLDNLLRKRSSAANGLDDDEDEEEDTEDDSFGYEGEATEDDLNEVNSDLDLENSESKSATPAELILQRCQIAATQIVCGLDETQSQSRPQQVPSQAKSPSADQPRDCLAPQKILKSADASTDDDDEGWLYTATAAATLEVATAATAAPTAAAATSSVDGLQSTAVSSTTATGGPLPPSDDSDKENKVALVSATTITASATATATSIATLHSSNYDSSSACSSSNSNPNSNSNSNGRLTETSATSRVTQLQMQIHSQAQSQSQMELQINGNAIISNNNCYSSMQHQPQNNNEGEYLAEDLAKIKMGDDEAAADMANGNATKSQQISNSLYSRADTCNFSVWTAETVASCHLPPRSPAKSAKSSKSQASNATVSGSTLVSPVKGKVSHDSIKQLVLEAEHLVRDAQETALKTPTKQKHSIIKISSTVKKREVTMPHPIKQRVEEWLEHQPSTPQLLTRSHTHELLPSCKPDDCEASGEASETDSVPQAGAGVTGGAPNGAGSDTSEGFTDSIATCMQTSTNSYGNSTERIGGSAEPIGQPVTPLGFGSSNQSLNVKIVKRTQTRRKSERPWSVSCLSQLTTDAAQLTTARIVENSPPGLASHSISESALDSLSPGPRPRAASSSGTGSNAAKKADSKGSLRRRKARKKRISAASAGRKSDSGSELGGDLTQTLMKSCESMSSQQLQEFTNALLSIQKGAVVAPLSPKGEVSGVASLADGEGGETHLMLPKFRVGSFTTAGLLATDTRLGALAALSNYMNEDEQQAAPKPVQTRLKELSTEDHHSSISETAWDNYQEKYNSENYSEGFDSDAARRLLEFGDDYRNFIDSQSDCCSSLSAANNLDSFSPPRMDSLQKHELKTLHINQDTITSSVDHARRQRALELQYERRRKTLEVRRKSCQDMDESLMASPQSDQQQQQLQVTPALSASATALMTTPKNQPSSHQISHRAESVGRKLDFGGMSHSAQSLLRRTSESDTSTRRRRTVTADERRRSSRNLEKCIKLIPATTSSSSGSDSEDGEQEMRSLLQQSRDRLDDTRALKIRCHLLRPEDYNEIINTCRDNIRCLEAVLRGPPGTVLSNHCAGQTKDLLAAWEDLLGWSENASAARKLQHEMSVLKSSLQRLGDKPTPELLDTEPAIQIAVEALKLEQTELASYRTNMLRLNASVHSWLTKQERRLQSALEEQEQQQESEQLKQQKLVEEEKGADVQKELASSGAVAITVTDSNGNQVEALATGEASTSTPAWDVHSLMSAEQEFHKHLKNEVSDMYSAWDEADARINTQLEMLTNSLIAWRQLESGLSEFQLALGQDRGTLKGLEGALDKGQATPVELAQNVKLVAKLLSEKVHVSQEQLLAVQQHLDPNHIYHITKFTASNGSLSDSGISDGGATSDGGLSERERRLGVLRRLAKQLELALAPGSEAMRSIAARMESAEADLKHLQNTCRDLIVRTAASHQQKQQIQQNQTQQVAPKANGHIKKQAAKGKAEPQSPGRRGKGARKARQAKKAGEDQQGEEPSLSPEQQKMVLKQLKTLTSGDGGDDPSDDPSLIFNLESSEEDGEGADPAQASKRGWAWRIARAAVPMQVALFTIFCAACLMQPNCCDNLNNLSMSFTPQLRYIRGPPPI
ncbi:uncharacterized protein LOC6734428 isoform X3 [Drosophila simulans]|uniref:Uncharacterized protein, isoform J n=1 Tax=Drosophila simulans TaxID=7240 RepID=A0A0J9RLB1_DROSI|nr:uncharacterized protein LOC6734428 isoform X3 [Drosophila simulans]KMY96681.1 uncharacterized protein Dsimw501_GD25703, isoform J [Drosophila simulans]